ncbi:MAG: hypothetical protein Q9197_000962 [Variospora fuerteventurae]
MATEDSSIQNQSLTLNTFANHPNGGGSNALEGIERIASQDTDSQAKRQERAVEKSSTQTSGTGDDKDADSSKPRKRTKTGCLTCRRRRIKCGEERPTCKNCVKSKRNCEGYTPRVIFKDPLGAYRPSGGAAHESNNQLQPIAAHNGFEAQHRQLQPRQIHLPVIAPHRIQLEHQELDSMKVPFTLISPFSNEPKAHPFGGLVYTPGDLPPPVIQHIARPNCSLGTSPVTPETDSFRIGHSGVSSQHAPSHRPDRDIGVNVTYPGLPSEWSQSSASSMGTPAPFHPIPTSNEYSMGDIYGQNNTRGVLNMPHPPRSSALHSEPRRNPKLELEHDQLWSAGLPPDVQSRYGSIEGFMPKKHDSGGENTKFGDCGPLNRYSAHSVVQSQALDAMPARKESSSRYDPTLPAHYDPTLEMSADTYYDVTSDEEQADPDTLMTEAPASNMGLMLALSANQTGRVFRSLTNFLNEPNVLASYRPSWSASPLMDPQTARVFCHFITATAPTLSLHNRHPTNPSVMFTGEPVPPFQRSLFTYTLPMMALTNQGLLHAQLALASLHIAKLQQTSPTPSLKHYHYALRRVAKAVGNPAKRRDIATLAATLLLGFFEVTTAEHNKWNSHLAGARELILEIDFVGMTRRIIAYKRETNLIKNGSTYNYGQDQRYNNHRRMSFDILRTDKELDEDLISILMGYRTRYDEYGEVAGVAGTPPHHQVPLTPKDVEDFEIQCDLYWWYAKQDMYQSLISGNRLLLSYDRWSHCPPRAPCGRLDAVYGSMDHLILLFARLTEFAARDRQRKIKMQAKADGERQMATFQIPSNANDQQPPPQPPRMYGMMPAPGHIHLPAAFDQSRQDHLNEANKIIVEDEELETATSAAEREWSDIWTALDLLEAALGPAYQPLSADQMTPLSTPFGPALYYRTYSIACLVSTLSTARIFATRVAPSMPPAAMVAAGVAAQQTAGWANIVGRITAGLQPVSSTAPLNPSHGAALMDCCMGIFHAGVQFREAAERGWTITTLRNIARLTGWQTAALIASGCERAWIAAAEMGRGPPYTRTMNASAKDDRVSGRSRAPNLGPPMDNNDRRFIHVNPGTRVYWAIGVIGMEEDMTQMKLE